MKSSIAFIHIPKNAGTSIKNICESNNILYCGHNVDPSTVYLDQLIVLRNPIDRFCSSVNYAMNSKFWIEHTNVGLALLKGYNSVESWVDLMINNNQLIWSIIKNSLSGNTQAFIGSKKLIYRHIFAFQKEWFINPKYVVLFDQIKIESIYFFKNILNVDSELPWLNKSSNDKNISNQSLQFLENFYKEDNELYQTYKSIDLEQRLKNT